jgi:DNA-binding MarR family transcriptional regulator
MDFAERAVSQWGQRYPDLDMDHLLVIGRLLRITGAVVAANDADLVPDNLSRGEFDLVCALRRSDRPLRPSEITTIADASPAAITKWLNHLARDGLVERATLERDRRVVLVSLTTAGEDLVDRIFPNRAAREAAVVAGLDAEEADQLARLLAKVLATVDPLAY